jgi:predicted flap endonuclease-1-like 5' DNA nuclease
MRKADNKNAPWLGGWLIAAAAGLVAFGVLVIVGEFDLFPAAAIAGGVALVAGLILGMPWGSAAAEPGPRVRKIVPNPAAVEPETPPPAPVAEAVVAAPAAFVSTPAPAAMPKAAAATKAATKPKAATEPKAATKPKAAAKPKADAKVEAKVEAKPKAAAKPKVAKVEGPMRLKAPRKGKADDLKEIEGIGPAMEKLVNEMGFYHFDQIAGWSDADVALVDAEMKTFKGRITRDKWVAQAKIIVTEGLEAFRERAKTNNY